MSNKLTNFLDENLKKEEVQNIKFRDKSDIEKDFRGILSLAHILVAATQSYTKRETSELDMISIQYITEEIEKLVQVIRVDYENIVRFGGYHHSFSEYYSIKTGAPRQS